MKEIKLLENQIDKLNIKDFDLEAWKQYTIVLLARIFGENNQKIQQIEKIEYDYSSWSLRDTSGSSEYLDTCKKLGREILVASIDELKTFGLPDENEAHSGVISTNVIVTALENELKISQFRELVKLINSDLENFKRKKEIVKLITNADLRLKEVLVDILSHPDLMNKL